LGLLRGALEQVIGACEALVAGVEDSVLRFVDCNDLALRPDMEKVLRARVERARLAITKVVRR
jgi:hypothetical protein